jgi:hypothetical protein
LGLNVRKTQAFGEGSTITKALENVSKLSVSELLETPGMPNAPERWRRLAALHCELSRHSGGKAYFLSYRDAAKAYDGLKRARTRAYVS